MSDSSNANKTLLLGGAALGVSLGSLASLYLRRRTPIDNAVRAACISCLPSSSRVLCSVPPCCSAVLFIHARHGPQQPGYRSPCQLAVRALPDSLCGAPAGVS